MKTNLRWNTSIGTLIRRGLIVASLGCLGYASAGPADEHDQGTGGITRLDITSRVPTFGGRTFGAAGSYEKIRGVAYGEIDPRDRRNAVITDLALAPVNARGNVEYSMDFYILKPIDQAKGNHQLFVEVNNRGSKLFGALNLSGGGNDPTTANDAGEAFLMNQGYTLAWNGWDPSALSGGNNLTIHLPIARNRDGSSITGPGYEYIVFDNTTTKTYPLSYPPATPDKASARLTVRDHLNDIAVEVPAGGWDYVADTPAIQLANGASFKQSAIYEFIYTAKDPIVAGIGFAATRDFVSLLRTKPFDDPTHRNPLQGDIRRVLAFTVSQPGRYMNDFVWLGFNEDRPTREQEEGEDHRESEGRYLKHGRKIFDGVENWIAGGDGVALNYRFAQPGRTERNRQNHLYPEAPFPFAYNLTHDPLTGKTDGRNARCQRTDTCPKIMMVNSANEYWVKAGSLLHTDPTGHDLPDPENVRFYLLSGLEHTVSGAPVNSAGTCAQFRNSTDPTPALRALFVDLNEWVDGIAPPASRVPRVQDGTAVFSMTTANSRNGVGIVPQDDLNWRAIPGVTYPYSGLITVRNLFDFGPRFAQGILSKNPPKVTGKVYPSFVSRVDADNNEIAGIRLPAVAVPVATTSGWGLRGPAFDGPDGCESSGQLIPFAQTTAQRIASGDFRPAISERYASPAAYTAAVTEAARRLQSDRLLLEVDVQKYIGGVLH